MHSIRDVLFKIGLVAALGYLVYVINFSQAKPVVNNNDNVTYATLVSAKN